MSVYKVGEWLINRRNKQLVEVVDVIDFADQDHVIVVKYFGSPYYMSETKPTSKINKIYDKAPLAQLLYSNNIQRR